MTLVNTVKSKQISGGAGCGSRVLVVPDHHWNVVPKGDNGTPVKVDVLGNDILLS